LKRSGKHGSKGGKGSPKEGKSNDFLMFIFFAVKDQHHQAQKQKPNGQMHDQGMKTPH
jgi:hypothetical protein